MITVFTWSPKGTNVGHAAASIGGGRGGDGYVSWWPTADWKETHPGGASTFANDVKSEGGRQPDGRVQIPGLNEPAGKKWWRSLKARRGSYSASNNNCAWAVITMLKAAGADDRIHWTDASKKYNVPLGALAPGLCVAAGVAAYVSSSGKAIVATADNCTTIWTPADALRYARAAVGTP